MKKADRNKAIIATSYAFCSLNCFIAWIASLLSIANGNQSVIFLALNMGMMVYLSLTDPRKEMRNSFAVISSVVMNVVFNILVAVLFSYWWILLLALPETVILSVLAKKHKR